MIRALLKARYRLLSSLPDEAGCRERHSSRRHVLLLAATALGSTLFGRLGRTEPADQGIGGTGFSLRPAEEDSDRGIGGTGVIGTIRKFGSIIVNDIRIAYPEAVAVRIDGQPASVADMKLGHVVRVVATSTRNGGFATQAIDISSEVVGRIDRVTPKTLSVLGQTVATSGLKGAARWQVGDRIAVSGLRRNDGTIAASLIEARAGTLSRVAGPIDQGADGRPRIGAIVLSGVDGTLIGQRAIVEGHADGQTLTVTRSTGEIALLPTDLRRLSVEAYVERRGSDLRLGSGLAVGGSRALDLPAGRSVRAVLNTTVSADGQIAVQTLRAGGHQYGAPDRTKGGGGENRTPGNGRQPMDFGPAAKPGGESGETRPSAVPLSVPGGRGLEDRGSGGLPGQGFGGAQPRGGFGGFGGGRR